MTRHQEIPPGSMAAILCGGQGRRLGGVRKPLLEVAGQTILQRQLAVLEPLFPEVVLLTDDAGRPAFADTGHRLLVDQHLGGGPLPAIADALQRLSPTALFVVAGDMPHLTPAPIHLVMARGLGDAVDLAAPFVGGHPEPLHTCYRPSCLPAMKERIAAGDLKVTSFWSAVRVALVAEEELRRLDPTLAFLHNLNTPDDLPSP